MPAPLRSAWVALLGFLLLIAPAAGRADSPDTPPPAEPSFALERVPNIDLSDPRALKRLRARAARVYDIRAGYFLRRGDLLKAVMAARQAIWYRPNDPRLHVRLGDIYRQAGLLDPAIAAWTKAIRIHADYVLPHVFRARARVASGEPGKAIAELDHALGLIGPDALLLEARGIAHEAAGNLYQAAADLVAANRLDSERAEAHAALARVRVRQDLVREALAEADKAVEINPHLADAYIARAAACQRLGNPQRAEADYTVALELDPQQSTAYLGRAIVLCRRGGLTSAIDDATAVIRLNRDNADAYAIRSVAYMTSGHFMPARADANEDVRLRPGDPVLWNNCGAAHESLGDLDQALACYDQAVRLNPNDWASRSNRATAAIKKAGQLRLCLLREGPAAGPVGVQTAYWHQALTDLNEAARLKPNDPRAYRQRATVHRQLGDPQRAAADQARGTTVRPGGETAGKPAR